MKLKEFLNKFKSQKEELSPRMYVLVRSDLKPGLQAAQACHAASYLSAADPLVLYQHPTTIVLGVSDEKELIEQAKAAGYYSTSRGFMFREPDLGMEATAYACFSNGGEFKDLSLALSDNLASLV